MLAHLAPAEKRRDACLDVRLLLLAQLEHRLYALDLHLERADGSRFSNGNGKLDGEPLQPADVLIIESGGGGGYGDPHRRPRASVAADVRHGYVSREAALRDYGMTEVELG